MARNKAPAFAILRFDPTPSGVEFSPEDQVTVVGVVESAEIAQQEVDRLNNLNQDKGVTYRWQHTRFVADIQ